MKKDSIIDMRWNHGTCCLLEHQRTEDGRIAFRSPNLSPANWENRPSIDQTSDFNVHSTVSNLLQWMFLQYYYNCKAHSIAKAVFTVSIRHSGSPSPDFEMSKTKQYIWQLDRLGTVDLSSIKVSHSNARLLF